MKHYNSLENLFNFISLSELKKVMERAPRLPERQILVNVNGDFYLMKEPKNVYKFDSMGDFRRPDNFYSMPYVRVFDNLVSKVSEKDFFHKVSTYRKQTPLQPWKIALGFGIQLILGLIIGVGLCYISYY